jgi:DNA-binding CsgD family transcriptional regulator
MTVTFMPQQQVMKESSKSSAPPEEIAEQRGGPGVLVLAPPMRLLHMNQRAWDLTSHIDHGENGNGISKAAKGLLPAPLLQLCAEIFQHLKDRTEAKDWEQFEVRRMLGAPERPLMIHGFGVPGNKGQEQSRVIIVMEELGRQNGNANQQAVERFQFTDREQDVVQCLAKGWTNKEISCELGIAMPTVKEHIRHIMEKTKSTTRTGVLAQIFRS